VRTTDYIDEVIEGWRRELPATALPEVALAKRLKLLSSLTARAVQPELSALGLTFAEFEVLSALRRTGKPYRRKPSELARTLLFTTGGISNVLQQLEGAGLVAREHDPDDARGRQVRLTAAGVKTAERAVTAVAEAQRDVFARVPDDVITRAGDALRELLVVVDRQHR
jgi:DNA-binding MarR family transcriptional regulator